MTSLRVRGIGKAYRRYRRKSGRLREWLGLGVQHELSWVLRDVSFDVVQGEAVGIVGANGAGKSSLLKIIAGTVRPTTGAYEVGGRVAALLELGLGFHPNFTGRENVLMAGHLLGIATTDIDRLMGEIEAFSEIGDYMNQPVRTYSSGMQVRLAFSVATVVRPDVLIVDEALSVGDAYFQHKSFERIRRFREAGTTLLFVSHQPGAVKALCDRAILLDRGVVLRDDAPDAVLDYYNAMIAAQRADHEIRQIETAEGRTTTRSGSADAVITFADMLTLRQSARAIRSGDPATVRLEIEVRRGVGELTAGILIRDRFGNDVFGINTFRLAASRTNLNAGDRVAVEFAFAELNLGVGSYSLSVALHAGDTHTEANFDWWDRALVFQVVPGNLPMSIGVCALRPSVYWVPPALLGLGCGTGLASVADSPMREI